MDEDGVIGLVIRGVGLLLAGLATAVGTLWKVNESKNRTDIKRMNHTIDEQGEEIKTLRDANTKLLVRLARLEGDKGGERE